MSRYPSAQATPVQPTVEGDTGFNSVDMKRDRSKLEPGVLALSVNKRLRRGKAETRNGIWPPVFANILNLDTIRGWGVYSNPNGEEVLLVAGDTEIYSMRDATYPITIQAHGDMADSVEFVQAHSKVIMFQGEDVSQLVWDGESSDGFLVVTKKDRDDTSTDLIPKSETAEHIGDRLLIITSANDIIATDVLDFTSYDPILQKYYINSGTADKIIRIFAYANGIVLVFKSRSVNTLLDYQINPAFAQVQLLNSSLGLVGRKAVVMLGGDVLFLSEPGGIYRVAQAFESRLQTVPIPVTDTIQPLIDRINWTAADGAVAKANGEYVYFAVPIDSSTRNNAMIVINGATGNVEGYDTWPDSLRIDDLLVTIYQGEKRLFALDKEAARIYVMYEGRSDFIYDEGEDEATEHQIEDVMETRGYSTLGWNAATRRDFKRVEIGVTTWAPSLTVTELTETAGDERALNSNAITKSRTEYDTFGRKDWVATNENDDWATSGRQDYCVVADGDGFLPGTGIDFDRKQTSTLRFSTKARGKWISYRIANTQGQADVNWVLAESSGTQREPRRAG